MISEKGDSRWKRRAHGQAPLHGLREGRDVEGGICDLCKAIIRGEALEGQHQIKKDADKSLHKEGLEIERKHRG